MENLILNVPIKALPGTLVDVSNYRRNGKLERGTIKRIIVKYGENHQYVSYEVLLDRRSSAKSIFYPNGGAPLLIRVGSDKIFRL
jgi:hypothetical protein